MGELLSKRDWIRNRVEEVKGDIQKVYSFYEMFLSENNAVWDKDSYTRTVRLCVAEYNDNLTGTEEFSPETFVKLEASKQRLQDINGQVKKSNRETYRLYNSLEEIFQEYVEVMGSVDLTKFNIKEHKTDKTSKVGIFQLSDNHMNEVIFSSEAFGNSFDFNIASKRLKKFVIESVKIFKCYNVKDVYIFLTGDQINSNRRLSEKLAQNTSLVRASLLATFLYQQVIIELSKNFNIHVASVVGNEARISQDFMDSSDILASENWDYLIFNNLRLIFNNIKAIEFIVENNALQSVVKMKNGFNALLTHGHTLKSSMPVDKQIGTLLQNYSYQGIKIHGVFLGHLHHASLGDLASRSSSLCGANAYSANDLLFISRASQNIYIVNEDLGYHGIKIDLQNVEGISGYEIKEELERYNVNRSSNVRVTIENLV